MCIVIIKNGEPIEAFYNPNLEGYIELDYDSLVARTLMRQLEVK